jgi:hypothetical protein
MNEADKTFTICAWTKKVKLDDKWISIEEFLQNHLGYSVTHGISDEAKSLFKKAMQPQEPTEEIQ